MILASEGQCLCLSLFFRVEVYNIAGQRVATLANGQMPAGVHTTSFDGSALASGVYLVRMQLGSEIFTHKMMLVK